MNKLPTSFYVEPITCVQPPPVTRDEKVMRCIDAAMACLDPESSSADERLAWLRLLDAKEGREPRSPSKE